MGEGNETMTTTDTTTTCSHCGREIGVTCGTDVATYVNGLPYCGEDAPESESTLWLGTSDDCGGEGMTDDMSPPDEMIDEPLLDEAPKEAAPDQTSERPAPEAPARRRHARC